MSTRDPAYSHSSNLIVPERELPPARPGLQDAAESVGSTVGAAVSRVRKLPERLQEAKARFIVIRGRAREQAGEKAREIKDKAGETAAYARARANRVAREYPLGVVVAAAGCGFLAGLALRVWRNHD